MPIESGSTIAELDNLWPLSGDVIPEGDNHLRLIKAVLKAQFPGVGGDGFSIAITATEAEINYLSGVTSGIQAQLDAIIAIDDLVAPAGTVMVFYQSAPPTGWTQLVANDDSMLRVVSAGGGLAAGTDSPILFDFSHVHTTSSHTLTVDEIPLHSHTLDTYTYGPADIISRISADNTGGAKNTDAVSTKNTGGGLSHNHGDTATAGSTFTPKYINVITATKD